MKLIVKTCIVFHVGPIRTRNQDLRLLSDSFRRHESNGSLRFDKRAYVENHIFRGKLYCLDLREISITLYPGLCFRNRAYP